MDYSDPLLVLIVVQVALYIFTLYELSQDYRSYLLSGSPRVAERRAHLTLVFSVFAFAVFFSIIFYLATSLLQLGVVWAYILVAIIIVVAVVLVVRKLYFLRCLEEWEEELDGIKFTVCHNRVVNAWYSEKDKKIYVSLLLKEMLSKEELKAVIHHELGHGKHGRLSSLESVVNSNWIWAVTTIALLVTLLYKTSVSSILTALFLLLLGASLTLPAMMISWISEHEADREAIRGTDPYHFMTMMIKIHVYGSFGEFLDDVKVKDVEELKRVVDASIQPGRIFLTLLKYSWNFPKQIQDLFTSPQYQTHPPLQLRLAPATRSALISS